MLVFFAPLLAYSVGKRGAPIENRTPYPYPPLTFRWDYFADFGAFAGDRIPLRPRALVADAWIDQHVFSEDPAFGGNASPTVVHGDDGFLFLAEDFNNACEPTGTIDGAVDVMEQLGDIIHDSGRQPVFIIPPNKTTIHGNLVPKDLTKLDCWTRFTDDLYTALSKSDAAGFVPVRDLIEDEIVRTRDPLYLRKDSHWNSLGSLVAVKAVVDLLAPGMWRDSDVNYEGLGKYTGDLTALEGLPSEDESDFYGVVRPGVTQTSLEVLDPTLSPGINLHYTHAGPDGSLIPGRTLLILDSFGEVSLHRIAPYFEDLTAIHFSNWEPNLFANLMAEADNVWIMSVERYFTWRFCQMLGFPDFLTLLTDTLNAQER